MLSKELIRKLEFSDLSNVEKLYPHQEFVRRYLSPYTTNRGVLLFHALGSGKSLICIAIAVDHYLHNHKRCLIVTKGNSGTESFKKQIDLYYDMAQLVNVLTRSEYNRIFSMDHYMALHNNLRKMSDSAIISKYSNHVLVFDEIHNIRKLRPDKAGYTKVYNSLEKITKMPLDIRVLLVTATPMTNDIEQLNSTMQLLTDKPGYEGLISYNAKIRHRPKEIYHGQHGYLTRTRVYTSTMIAHQQIYHTRERDKGMPKDIYRTLTHVSLFCFPDLNGMTELYGRKLFSSGIFYSVRNQRMITSMKTGISRMIKYTSYHVDEQYREWLVGDKLRMCSSKYWTIMNIIQTKAQGPVFIYVEEVRGSGLLLLANILEAHGYELYTGDHLDTIRPKKRYTFCVGDQSIVPNKSDRLEGFNSPMNKYGDYVSILIGSKIIGESITLLNVRMFHVATIHWNDSTMEQAIGRVIRSGSHDTLPEEERRVDIYIHAALYDNEGTDLHKLDICNRKQEKILEMESILKDNAIDKYIGKKLPMEELDPTTYIKHYLNESLYEIVINAIKPCVKPIRTSKVLGKLDGILHPDVVTEVLYRIVTRNIKIGDRYLRETYDKLYLVDDPSLPFFFVPFMVPTPIKFLSIRDNTLVSLKPNIPPPSKRMFRAFRKYTLSEKVAFLRDMQFLSRISFVENFYELDEDIRHMFGPLFIRYKGTLYHIMCYRIPGDAYTAVLPIPKPKTLQNKLRMFTTEWKYIDSMNDVSEKEIISEMQKIHDKRISRIDHREEMFLIISLIDNKARLRTRIFEVTPKGDQDKRFVRKGRCLPSIIKADLALLFGYISMNIIGCASWKPASWDKFLNSNYDKHVRVYGYKSMKNLSKKNPELMNAFVYAMDKFKTEEIVTEIESMMITSGKYLFL
jgi:superfamily II DNA or RNA helicase